MVSRGPFPPRVYRNGVLANFGAIETLDLPSLGPTPVYRARLEFLPFDAVTSIVPARYEERSIEFGSDFHEALQIETGDLRVGLLPL